jgi:hypothetical protein
MDHEEAHEVAAVRLQQTPAKALDPPALLLL